MDTRPAAQEVHLPFQPTSPHTLLSLMASCRNSALTAYSSGQRRPAEGSKGQADDMRKAAQTLTNVARQLVQCATQCLDGMLAVTQMRPLTPEQEVRRPRCSARACALAHSSRSAPPVSLAAAARPSAQPFAPAALAPLLAAPARCARTPKARSDRQPHRLGCG